MFKKLLPPFLHEVLKPKKYGYFGEYKNWPEAKKNSSGYENEAILEKVRATALKVKDGGGAYERDGILFNNLSPEWRILGPLLWLASKNNHCLSVLDFGGSLGSTYYQNREFLKDIKLDWSIIEQPKFVKSGKKDFENEELKFYNLEEYSKKPDLIILGSVLQYLEEPYKILKKLVEMEAKYILVDKTPFWEKEEVITIQKVPEKIYKASYPSWIFNLDKFLAFLTTQKYKLVYKLELPKEEMFSLRGQKVSWQNFLFEKDE